jgi:hypothetical protein
MPCVFTSYNSNDAKLDAKHLENMGAEMIWKQEWNKWTGQKVESVEINEPCRFDNAFWLGFQGRRGVSY